GCVGPQRPGECARPPPRGGGSRLGGGGSPRGAPGGPRAAGGGAGRGGAAARRHHVPRTGARRLRCRPLIVSRPGPDPDQDPGIRSRRQRDARVAAGAHVARSRHGVRHRRHRPRRPVEPDCGDPPGEPARGAGRGRRRCQAMSPIDDLPPLREVISRHGLMARKSLGQNFLLDLNLTARIARAAGPLDDAYVVEIGPGPGGLTRALLAAGARRVVAIERDPRCLAALAEIAAHYPDRLTVIEGDALEIDASTYVTGAPARNVATALLVAWVGAEPGPPWYDAMVLMFQREVAERIVAAPGSKSYGRLSVLAGWRTEARILFDVPAAAFVPRPKVTSSVVRLEP